MKVKQLRALESLLTLTSSLLVQDPPQDRDVDVGTLGRSSLSLRNPEYSACGSRTLILLLAEISF